MKRLKPYLHPPTCAANCDPLGTEEFGPRPDGRTRCDNRGMSGDDLRCRKLAMPGSNRCATHINTNKIVASRYSTALKTGTIAESYRRHLASDDFKSVRDELALVRAFAESAIAKLDGHDMATLSPAACSVVLMLVGEVRELVEAAARIDQKMSINLTVTDIYLVVGQVFDIVRQYVSEPSVLSRIGAALETLSIAGAQPLPATSRYAQVVEPDFTQKQRDEPV